MYHPSLLLPLALPIQYSKRYLHFPDPVWYFFKALSFKACTLSRISTAPVPPLAIGPVIVCIFILSGLASQNKDHASSIWYYIILMTVND